MLCPVNASRVALLLRGFAFRPPPSSLHGAAGTSGCSAAASAAQLNATQTLITHVIEPLEQVCGSTVDIIATECSRARGDCKLLDAYFRKLGSRTRVTKTACATIGQPHSVRMTLILFKQMAIAQALGLAHQNATVQWLEHQLPLSRYGSAKAAQAVAQAYDLVIITRHDIWWRAPILSWRGLDFERFNFFGACEPRCVGCERGCERCPRPTDHPIVGTRWGEPHAERPSVCVQDAIHMMPAKLFGAFDGCVGAAHVGCFESIRVNKGTGTIITHLPEQLKS